MRYVFVLFLITLTACSSRYQSTYRELQREIVIADALKGWHTIGRIRDNTTIVFGRLKVYDADREEDITRTCQIRGLSNKYYRMAATGPEFAHVKDDSLFYSTAPASNLHPGTGLFAVHTDKGPVGLEYPDNNSVHDFDGGYVYCRKKGNKYAELRFKSAVAHPYSKTYIGDITLTFFRGDAFEYTFEDKMDETYTEFTEVVPSAANEKVELLKSIGVKY